MVEGVKLKKEMRELNMERVEKSGGTTVEGDWPAKVTG